MPAAATKRSRARLIATVIVAAVVLAILVAIGIKSLFFRPSVLAAQTKTREAARILTVQVVNSIKPYYAEYSRYPLPNDETTQEMTPMRTDTFLTGVLMGINPELNPKKIKFLPDLRAVEKPDQFGIKMDNENPTIVDPWGEELYVYLDADYSGDIENPDPASPKRQLYQGVLVFSAGPDKDPTTWEDNVISWDRSRL